MSEPPSYTAGAWSWCMEGRHVTCPGGGTTHYGRVLTCTCPCHQEAA